jgi:hypothetical protein
MQWPFNDFFSGTTLGTLVFLFGHHIGRARFFFFSDTTWGTLAAVLFGHHIGHHRGGSIAGQLTAMGDVVVEN